MSDVKDDYYAEVDNTFADLRKHPFRDSDPLLQPTEQEERSPGPVGWVSNASAADGTPTVEVDADGLHVSAGDIGSGAGTTIDTDGILVEDGLAQERVRLGLLSASTYGLRITNASGTVIIDGSSNVFKIAATGTITSSLFANPANPGSTASTTLSTGFTYVPSNLIYLSFNSGTSARLTPYAVFNNAGSALDWWDGYTELVNTNQTKVNIAVSSSRAAGNTAAYTFRYFVLQEVAF